MYNLKGKTAVITGGNSGVGAATAMLFAKSGANVVISARRQAALDEVASKIKAEGGNVLTVLTDISKDEDCKNLMKATVDKFGGIDILVNNAGVLDTGLAPIDKFDDVEIQKLISINQVGTMQCIRAALEYMQEGSSIVNVASVAGVNGGGGAAYVSTKSAIIGITKHTALLLADKYIRCNAICPGTIVTPMTMNMKPECSLILPLQRFCSCPQENTKGRAKAVFLRPQQCFRHLYLRSALRGCIFAVHF